MKRGKSKINLKNSKNTKIVFGILALILISAVFVYAIDTLSTGYRVPKNGGSKEITAHGIPCKKVTNNNPSRDIFVPTNKSTEWTNFISNHPSFVSIVDCATGTCEPYCPWFYECGSDGCEGNCGTCDYGEICNSNNQCEVPEIPPVCFSSRDCSGECDICIAGNCESSCSLTERCDNGECVPLGGSEECVYNDDGTVAYCY